MSLLKRLEHPHREGSDSSRRRICFDNTGSRFVATVNRAELQQFVTAVSACPVVRESCEASLGISRDLTLWRYC